MEKRNLLNFVNLPRIITALILLTKKYFTFHITEIYRNLPRKIELILDKLLRIFTTVMT